jgi:nitrile hydratase
MDGVHDMGGLEGFGPIVDEPESMGFHAVWHGRMFALSRVVRYTLPFGGDHVRQAIERMEPGRYLKASYYAKWLEGNITCLKAVGAITEAELAGGAVEPLPETLGAPRAMAADLASGFIFGGMTSNRTPPAASPGFEIGETVRTIAHGIAGHTRLPRYARGKHGVIEAFHGAFVLADANAAGAPRTEWCYRIAFGARELWGAEAAEGDSVTLDVWESYLEKSS